LGLFWPQFVLVFFEEPGNTGVRPRGRLKKTWTEIVQKDCQACKLNSEDAMDHKRWRKQIRDD